MKPRRAEARRGFTHLAEHRGVADAASGGRVIDLRELMMILELHRQGLSVSAIAERTGLDRKTVRKYIRRGLVAPQYKPRVARRTVIDPYRDYLRERLLAWPQLTGARLLREIRDMGYAGGKTALGDFLRSVRPAAAPVFEVRFETPAGQQAQVDFAEFRVRFAAAPEVERKVWLFAMVLGHSRYLWAQFVLHQDLATVLRCHMEAFEHFGGVPREILYDRMKTAVLGEPDADQPIVYNAKLLGCGAHYGFAPRACAPYRAKTKGKVERPYRYIRADFFLARAFTDIDDMNQQLRAWLDTVANVRRHGTTDRIVAEHFAEERPHLLPLPAGRFDAVLRIERRLNHEGCVSVGGNYYSVPDGTRGRAARDRNDRRSGAHPARRPARCRAPAAGRTAATLGAAGPSPAAPGAARRSDPAAVAAARPRGGAAAAGVLRGHRASSRRCAMSTTERIRRHLVGLKMPRALEALQETLARIEQGEVTALEAIDALLGEEYSTRESRRIKMALQTARLTTIKTLAGYDFSFQPSLERNRVLALAQLDFIERRQCVHLLGPPGTGKSHLAIALGVEAVKAGKSVYFATLAELVDSMRKAEREGKLRERVKFLSRYSLLVVDEIGYLPVGSGGGNLFFQLVNACYERCALIMTSNRGFGEWAEIFGDAVVATALLDRLLHHAVVIPIEGNSYRLREHADLIPEHLRNRGLHTEAAPTSLTKRRPGRPRKDITASMPG